MSDQSETKIKIRNGKIERNINSGDYGNACLNKCVLRPDLNRSRVLASLRPTGSEFHNEGATELKDRPPADFKFHLRTLRSFTWEERSVRNIYEN